MAKYVPDIKTQRWVIISETRVSRPDQSTETPQASSTGCPFCPGHEAMTPPEVYRMGSGDSGQPGWTVRVIPNKYPITDYHEVIIHSPDDASDIEDLPLEQVHNVLVTYRDRALAHENDGHVIIFCNHGHHAGASLKHPHSQLVVVPKQINLDALSREPIQNIVSETDQFISYCPDFSQWPFEKWIAPKALGTKFSDSTDVELRDLSQILKTAIQKVEKVYNDPKYSKIHKGIDFGYNYYISPGKDWFLRIIPRFIHRAGFELGTGLSVNIIDPTDAAAVLRSIKVD